MSIKTEVEKVAQQMQQVGMEYDKLFDNFGIQLYEKLSKTKNSCEQMDIVHKELDEILEAFSLSFPNKTVIACKTKCSHCCSFPIHCSPQTIEYIASHIEASYSDDEIKSLIVAFHKNIEDRQAPFFRATCPFLDEDNCCKIYEQRPLSCRWFTSPDASLCERSIQSGETIPQQQTQHRIYQLANTALVLTSENKDKDDAQVEFIPAILKRLEK
ncbi:MAG: YkgJ family cysteine cluster protein [Arcobacter sp.]|uniref:YkgJ family cysteine cluster protein n=1 Tax=Arcobacter sp. TaxID=1872629 RepID=UPI003AFF9680